MAISGQMPPGTPCTREPLVDAITGFLTHMHVPDVGAMRPTIERAIDDAGQGALEALRLRLEQSGSEWTYCPKDPLARRLHHVLADRVLREAPALLGGEHLEAVAGKPMVIVANHLSYSDANAIEVILHLSGRHELADRLAVVAGPKVYSDLRRRFSSLCFGTIKTPQSAERSTDSTMTPREVAAAARRSIDAAVARLARGEAVLVFPEGTRSRSGQMQPFLSGVTRYFTDSDVAILPVGIWGTEALFPIGEHAITPLAITLRVGRPIRAGALTAGARGDRRLAMDCLGYAVGGLLPPAYRGVYAATSVHNDAARHLHEVLFG
jgi:1-acyl-sn-glycerol-3-phosphate acyltransferase